jgi:hypothetical protein
MTARFCTVGNCQPKAPSAEAALRKVKAQMAQRILARTGRRVRSWRVETY